MKHIHVAGLIFVAIDDTYVLDHDEDGAAVRRNFWSRLMPGTRTTP